MVSETATLVGTGHDANDECHLRPFDAPTEAGRTSSPPIRPLGSDQRSETILKLGRPGRAGSLTSHTVAAPSRLLRRHDPLPKCAPPII